MFNHITIHQAFHSGQMLVPIITYSHCFENSQKLIQFLFSRRATSTHSLPRHSHSLETSLNAIYSLPFFLLSPSLRWLRKFVLRGNCFNRKLTNHLRIKSFSMLISIFTFQYFCLLHERQQVDVGSAKIHTKVNSKIVFCFLPALSLILWAVKDPKNFKKVVVLKI